MKVIKKECHWCEKTYAVKDSTADERDWYCSEECEEAQRKADADQTRWVKEIDRAWNKYLEEYEPGEDECNPRYVRDEARVYWMEGNSRRKYLAFKERYEKWKNNHCWKESFWEWDGSSGGSFFGGGGGVGGDGGGCFKAVIKLIGFAVVAWLGWIVIKSGWNWMFGGGGGGNEVITEAAIMKKWEEHLEKRREAFDDGKPEKEIEAKGLRNYTWDEWQEKFKKEQDELDKQRAEKAAKKEANGDEENFVTQRAKEIGEQAQSVAKGLGDKAKGLWQSISSSIGKKDAEKEETEKESSVKAETEAEAKAKAEAETRARVEAEVRAKVEAEVKAKAEAETRARVEAEARAKAEAEPMAKAEKPISGQQTGTRRKASKDSKAIGVVVQGKGKTKDAALRSALRRAVWNTVGTWVGSKTRMDENRDKVMALVETVTEADIRKFEVVDTQQQGDTIVVKVKVSVLKKQIAPKFAKVFPDVFNID